MSGPHIAPKAGDVFSDPFYPSPPSAGGQSARASSQDKRTLVPASKGWVLPSDGMRGPGEALEPVREDDEESVVEGSLRASQLLAFEIRSAPELTETFNDATDGKREANGPPGFDSPPPSPAPQLRGSLPASHILGNTPSHAPWIMRSGSAAQETSSPVPSPPGPPRFASVFATPSKSRFSRLDEDPLLSPSDPAPRQTASSPTTPLRPGHWASTLGPPRASPAKRGEAAGWTWPVRTTFDPSVRTAREAVYDSPRAAQQGWDHSPAEATPTKRTGQAAPLVASPPRQAKPVQQDEVATRYVLISHLDRDLSEQDLREIVLVCLRHRATLFVR